MSQSIVNYKQTCSPAAADACAKEPRPLSKTVRTPQINLFGGYRNMLHLCKNIVGNKENKGAAFGRPPGCCFFPKQIYLWGSHGLAKGP